MSAKPTDVCACDHQRHQHLAYLYGLMHRRVLSSCDVASCDCTQYRKIHDRELARRRDTPSRRG